MKKGPVTIRDIALKLNISISTVSRALRGAADINRETRDNVLRMAKELNYEPNQVAQSLRTKRTHTLGIIVPDLVTHFFSSNISGIQEVATRHGYNVMICQSNECYETEVRNIHTLVAARVDGLLISLSRETSNYDHLKALQNKSIPLVCFDRICDELNTTKIIVDDYDGAFKATEHLIEVGCKHIAHISGPEHLSISKNRLHGYVDALRKNNMPCDERLIRRCNLSSQDIMHQVKALLSMEKPPDAIFALNDPVAVEVIQVLKENDIRIPDDIAVVGFTNEPVSALIEPSLTTVAQPAYKIGQIAARHILEQIEQPEDFLPQSIVLKTELIVRNSSRRR